MRRIRTELRCWAARLVACSLLVGAPLTSSTARAQDSTENAQRASARAHFAKGVALAKAHDYAQALNEFQQAYAAVPHFSVLYNIGQARLALGESAEAVSVLQRYLDEGGSQIDAKRRAEVEATLQRERARLPPTPETDSYVFGEAAPPATVPAAATETATEAVPTTATVPAATTATATDPATAAPAPAAPLRYPRPYPPKATSRDRRTLAYAVGAAGVALSGGALAHYLWNRSRYQDWQNEYAAYYRDPTELNRASANTLSKSIDDASVITVVLAVGAGVALGTSGVLWLTSAPTSDVRRGRFEPLLGAQGTF